MRKDVTNQWYFTWMGQEWYRQNSFEVERRRMEQIGTDRREEGGIDGHRKKETIAQFMISSS